MTDGVAMGVVTTRCFIGHSLSDDSVYGDGDANGSRRSWRSLNSVFTGSKPCATVTCGVTRCCRCVESERSGCSGAALSLDPAKQQMGGAKRDCKSSLPLRTVA